MIKFSYTVPEDEECYTAMRTIDMSVDSEQNLYAIIEVFSDFLKTSGYDFDGQIELISKEKVEAEDEAILKSIADYYFNSVEDSYKDKEKRDTKRSVFL